MKLKANIKILMASIILMSVITPLSGQTKEKIELMYDDVWGSLYNPEPDQCDKTPTITADGSVIDTLNASKQRWIAVSQDMLWSPRRHKLFVKDTLNDHRYEGRIKFGDTIWVESPNPNINGKWVVHDLMNKKYKNAIDFLQTTGDGHLYDNNKLWDGKFKIISVYKINKGVDNYVPKVITPNLWLFRPSIVISAISISYDEAIGNFVERPKDELVIINKLNDIWNCLHLNHIDAEEKAWRLRVNMYKRKMEKDISDREIDSIKSEIRRYDALEKMYKKEIKKLNKCIIIN